MTDGEETRPTEPGETPEPVSPARARKPKPAGPDAAEGEPAAHRRPHTLRARVTINGRPPDVVEFPACHPDEIEASAVAAYLRKHGMQIQPPNPVVELLP